MSLLLPLPLQSLLMQVVLANLLAITTVIMVGPEMQDLRGTKLIGSEHGVR